MSRIPDHMVQCSFDLYKSKEDASNAAKSGGCGFLVRVPSPVREGGYVYAITAKHLIDDGFYVMRINRKQGDSVAIDAEPTDWVPHPDGDDVAVFDLKVANDFEYWSVSTELFIRQETIEAYKIGYGDDTFLIGRLVVHSGRTRNQPVVRFGNISLMPNADEPIKQKDRPPQEAFLVECRSISGFSGSSVFVTTSQTYIGEDAQRLVAFRQKEMGFDSSMQETSLRLTPVAMDIPNAGPWLLGLDTGHLRHWGLLHDEKRKEIKVEVDGKKSSVQVEMNTGFSVVIPSWRIKQILDLPELVTQRDKAQRKRTAKKP